MERINIAQVDIDVEALINKSAEVRQRIMEVSDQMKALRDALNKGGISVQEYTRQMALLQNVQRENQREQRAYDNLISSHIAVQHQTMQANNTLTGSIRELGTALAQNRRIYEDFTQAQRESAEGKQLLETLFNIARDNLTDTFENINHTIQAVHKLTFKKVQQVNKHLFRVRDSLQ